MLLFVLSLIFCAVLMPYISLHGESTEQQLDRDAEPLHSSELYPPEPPCWQDQWLSEIAETEQHLLG